MQILTSGSSNYDPDQETDLSSGCTLHNIPIKSSIPWVKFFFNIIIYILFIDWSAHGVGTGTLSTKSFLSWLPVPIPEMWTSWRNPPVPLRGWQLWSWYPRLSEVWTSEPKPLGNSTAVCCSFRLITKYPFVFSHNNFSLSYEKHLFYISPLFAKYISIFLLKLL